MSRVILKTDKYQVLTDLYSRIDNDKFNNINYDYVKTRLDL